jgi:hypothetical protein
MTRRTGGQPQHPPPQQPPPPEPPDGAGRGAEPPRPVSAIAGSSRTVSVCPAGHGAGSSAFDIDRTTSKVSPQARQRTSYVGTVSSRVRPLCCPPHSAAAGDNGGVPRSNVPRRRGRRRPAEPAPELDVARALGNQRLEGHADGEWHVRQLSGSSSDKTYRCPGCNQEIRPGVPHVVAWPAEAIGAFGGVTDRRHWHTACWGSRDRRGRR